MHDEKVTAPTISTLLLIPADGDPRGLLAEGSCGARMPMLYLRPGREAWSRIPAFGSWDATGWRFGLVPAHEGKPVPEGMDRWYRVLNRAFQRNKYHPPVRWDDTMNEVVLFFRAGHMRSDLGTPLALDPAGRDVTDEVMRG